MKLTAQPKHSRSTSIQHEPLTSPKTLLNQQDIGSRKREHLRNFLSRFDDSPEKHDIPSQSVREDKYPSFPHRTTETSYFDLNQKKKEANDVSKNEMTRRLSKLEQQISELLSKNPENRVLQREPEPIKREEIERINGRLSGVESRVDAIGQRLDQLTVTLESFMKKIQNGALNLSPAETSASTSATTTTPINVSKENLFPLRSQRVRREEPLERAERKFETKFFENSYSKIRETPDLSATSNHRIPSRDTVDIYSKYRREGQEQGELGVINRETRTQERSTEGIGEGVGYSQMNTSKELKGGLRSPDTERKRKNVSWTDVSVAHESINGELENGLKRRKAEKDDQRSSTLRVREILQNPSEQTNVSRSTRLLGEEEESVGEGRRRYRLNEGKSARRENREVDYGMDKEKKMEEKRKRIDEEIESRLHKLDDIRKRSENVMEDGRNSRVSVESKQSYYPYNNNSEKENRVHSREKTQVRDTYTPKYRETPNSSSMKMRDSLRYTQDFIQ